MLNPDFQSGENFCKFQIEKAEKKKHNSREKGLWKFLEK